MLFSRISIISARVKHPLYVISILVALFTLLFFCNAETESIKDVIDEKNQESQILDEQEPIDSKPVTVAGVLDEVVESKTDTWELPEEISNNDPNPKKNIRTLESDVFADPEQTYEKSRICNRCGHPKPCNCIKHPYDDGKQCRMIQLQSNKHFRITSPNQYTNPVAANSFQNVDWDTEWLSQAGFQTVQAFLVGGEPAQEDSEMFNNIGFQNYRESAPQTVHEKVQIYIGETSATTGTLTYQLPYSIPNGFYQYTVCAFKFGSGIVNDCREKVFYMCTNSPWIKVFHDEDAPGKQEYVEI